MEKSASINKYAVVKFTVTEEIEAVPLSWLRSDENSTVCSWPPYKSMSLLTTWGIAPKLGDFVTGMLAMPHVKFHVNRP